MWCMSVDSGWNACSNKLCLRQVGQLGKKRQPVLIREALYVMFQHMSESRIKYKAMGLSGPYVFGR